MNIKVLDRASLGADTPFSELYKLGKVTEYESSTPEEVLERINDADVIIINKIKITCDVLSAAKKLKLICVFATGYDNIDLEAAKRYGVGVCNVPGYSTDSVALFTVSIALSLYTHMTEYSKYVRDGSYTKSGIANRLIPVYHELKGKIWGIIGYGNIGKAVARVARAFGAEILVYKRNNTTDKECTDIDTLCRLSDIITVHCPLNDTSINLINKDRIALMKKDVVIVNTARGAVVNEKDIAKAIEAKEIGAFGADVYTKEPFDEGHPYNSIKSYDNVILTPHAAWGSYESRERCLNIICDNIKSFFSGKILNRVDK